LKAEHACFYKELMDLHFIFGIDGFFVWKFAKTTPYYQNIRFIYSVKLLIEVL